MKSKKTDPNVTVNRIRGTFALLTVFLVIIGQTILYTSPVRQETGMPVFLWLCIAGVILFIGSLAFRPPHFLQLIFSKVQFTGSTPWVVVAIMLSLLATVSTVLFQKVGNLNYLPVISLWLSGAICYVAAFSKDIFSNLRWKSWLKTNRNEIIAIGVVALVGILVRFYHLGSIPRVINGDEGRLGLAAESTIKDPLSNPFALWDNIGALYLQGVYYVIKLLGATPFSLRLLPAIGGVLAIPALYLFARQVAGKRVALISAALLAFSHFHINFSRTAGADYIHTTWLVPLDLYFLLSGLEKRSFWRTALAGVLLAIYFSIFQTAQITIVIVFIYLLAVLLFFRSWFKAAGRQILVFWGGFLVPLLPEAFYIWQHPSEFLARLGASGTFQTGWLSQTMASTGQSAVQILAGRVLHAFLSLIYYPALDFYGSPIPPLTLISATLFLIGLGVSLWRTRTQNYLLLNSYFWGFTLAVGIFAIPPSADSYRMLIVLPAAILMAAIGFDQILAVVGLGWDKARLGYPLVASITLLSILATNLWTYFGDFAGNCRYADNPQGRFASYLGSYARTVKPEDTIYLLSNDIYFYGSHASVDFLSQGRKIINVKESVDTVTVSSGETIVANPDRFDELKSWVAAHPGGELYYFYDCTKTIMVVYQSP
jgi:4-amino-4-deoxy-L-arabinose transferase-like glycosyltransferase